MINAVIKEEEKCACKRMKRSRRLHHKDNTLKEAIAGFTEKVSSVTQYVHCENFHTDADCLPFVYYGKRYRVLRLLVRMFVLFAMMLSALTLLGVPSVETCTISSA